MSPEDYNAEPDGLIGLTVQPGYVDGEAVTNPNSGKRARVHRLFTSTISRPTRTFADDNDSGFIGFCQCDRTWCSERANSVTDGHQDSAKRKPIPSGGGSRDVPDAPTLTDVPTRPPMFDATGAEKLGAEMSCPPEASSQDAGMSCPPCPTEAQASSQDVRPVVSTADAMSFNQVVSTADTMQLSQVTSSADAMTFGQGTPRARFVESVTAPLILCDGTTQIARSQLVNDTGLSIDRRRFAYSNVLEWKPQPKGELPVSGFPHYLDHGGYLSDGQSPTDDPRAWHRRNGGLSIRRGICIPPYYVPGCKDLPEWEQVSVPCLLLPDETGLLRRHLCDEVHFECETDVNIPYLWDDTAVNDFTTNRARLDAELGRQTEFPADAPMNRRRMHPDKLARRKELFETIVDMLEESPQTYQQCRNFRAAEKWHERLLQNHIDYLRKLRKQLNILNPTFPLAFALSTWGRGLQSPDRVWAAIMACTTQTGRVEYHDPPERAREDTPVAQTVLTDVPEYPSLYFKRNDNRSKFQRAMIANTLREIIAYSICIPFVHGMTIHHDTTCRDKGWMNKNILYLMGHKFDSDTDKQINRRIHLQNNIWRNGLFNAHRTSFTDTNHYLRVNPSQYTSPWTYCQDGDSYSDDIRTERS
jgi:hypothetical protein